MKAWIARDADGTPSLFSAKPTWEDSAGGYWYGTRCHFRSPDVEPLAVNCHVTDGHCQQIKLTARPIGEAEGGEA